AVRIAAIKLHEANAALDHAAGEEAARAEFLRFALVEAVKSPRRRRFLAQIDNFRRMRLHAKRQFIRGDAGRQLRIFSPRLLMLAVEAVDEIERASLLPIGDARRIVEMADGAGPARHESPLISGGKVPVAPSGRAPFYPALRIGENDERRHVLVLG